MHKLQIDIKLSLIETNVKNKNILFIEVVLLKEKKSYLVLKK